MRVLRLPLEPAPGPLDRSVFAVGKRTTSGSALGAAVDGTTGERRRKFESEGGSLPIESSRHEFEASGVACGPVAVQRLGRVATLDRLRRERREWLRELTSASFKTCVALELEPDLAGSSTTMEFAGKFRRRARADGSVARPPAARGLELGPADALRSGRSGAPRPLV